MAGLAYCGRFLLIIAVLCLTACLCEARGGRGGGGRGFRGGSRFRYGGSGGRSGQASGTKEIVWLALFGVFAVAVIVGILAKVYCCPNKCYCRCKKKLSGSARYAACPVPTSDVGKHIPINNRTATSNNRAASPRQKQDHKTPATAPPTYESVVGGMKGRNSEAAIMNALPYPAKPSEDAVNSSADYSTALHPANSSDNLPAYPTTGYPTELPYPANSPDNLPAYPTTGYPTELPYPANPCDNSSATPATTGYSTAALPYSANPSVGYSSGLSYSHNS